MVWDWIIMFMKCLPHTWVRVEDGFSSCVFIPASLCKGAQRSSGNLPCRRLSCLAFLVWQGIQVKDGGWVSRGRRLWPSESPDSVVSWRGCPDQRQPRTICQSVILVEGGWLWAGGSVSGRHRPPSPSLEEKGCHLTTLTVAKSSWGQTRVVWVDPGLAAAALEVQSQVWALPSQLWSWFGRGIWRVNGSPDLGFPFAPSSQDKASFLILPF